MGLKPPAWRHFAASRREGHILGGGGGRRGSKVKEVLLQRDLFEVGKPRKLQVYLVEG